jgi:hypothetical protein
VIGANFPPDTIVGCNFFDSYGPHLPYYAHRMMLGGLAAREDWDSPLNEETDPVAGLIWMGEPNAKKLVDSLPPGTREERSVLGFPFVIWKPEKVSKPKS